MKRQKLRKSAGVLILEKLAELGVKFFFFTGVNGAGKDLQAKLAEILLLWHTKMRAAHVGTSDAIRHHSKDEGELGQALRLAKENEAKGILFPDKPTLEAVAKDVEALYLKGFNTFILTGLPRGPHQPWLVADIKDCEFLDYYVGLGVAITRAHERTRQRLAAGLEPRPDDHAPIVRKRWHDHRDQTVPALCKVANHCGVPLKTIAGKQPVIAVLSDTLKAMGVTPREIEECLYSFEKRVGPIKNIMQEIDGVSVSKPKLVTQAAPKHVEVVDKVESPAATQAITNPKWERFIPHRRTFMAPAMA